MTFLAENYTSKEAGRVMRPACLFETPHDLTICLNFRRTLVSYGDRTQTEDEQQLQRDDGGSDDLPEDDGQQQDEDVDEVDELIRKAKATARQQQAEHAGHEEHKYPDRTDDNMDTGDDQNFDRPRTPPPEPLSGVHTYEERESPGNERMRRQEGNKRAQRNRGRRPKGKPTLFLSGQSGLFPDASLNAPLRQSMSTQWTGQRALSTWSS